MSTQYALTTVDNPFDPFTEFDEWFEWDRAAGYDTPSYMARIVMYSSDLSESDQTEAVSDGIDEIIEEHGGTFYKKLSREIEEAPEALTAS